MSVRSNKMQSWCAYLNLRVYNHNRYPWRIMSLETSPHAYRICQSIHKEHRYSLMPPISYRHKPLRTYCGVLKLSFSQIYWVQFLLKWDWGISNKTWLVSYWLRPIAGYIWALSQHKWYNFWTCFWRTSKSVIVFDKSSTFFPKSPKMKGKSWR